MSYWRNNEHYADPTGRLSLHPLAAAGSIDESGKHRLNFPNSSWVEDSEKFTGETAEPGTGRIRRGEMYYVSGAQTEHSMSANRPAIIISNNAGNLFGNEVIVVWLTRKIKKPLPTHVLVKTDNTCTAMCEHIETVAKSRVENYIGMLTPREMRALDEALRAAIGLPARVSNADL